jgi:hypothetical protein
MTELNNKIREALDTAFEEALELPKQKIISQIPIQLLERIDNWQFGKYGWTSPVNLIVTTAWYKWLHPQQDICKMWAKDANESPIAGAFSIRSQDEKFTVPLVTKKEVHKNFCSSNSGMQGTRAIEKMRNLKRLSRNAVADQGQKVLFDLQLFKDIINDIEECNETQAKYFFIYLMHIAIDIQKIRNASLQALENTNARLSVDEFSFVMSFLDKNPDPQFVKCVGIAIMESVLNSRFGKNALALKGVEGHKTAADARALTPGDFWFERNNQPFIGVEVKDKSKSIGFDVLSAIGDRKEHNPSLKFYFLISAAAQPVKDHVRNDKHWQMAIDRYRNQGIHVVALNLNDIYFMSRLQDDEAFDLLEKISTTLPRISSLKRDTIEKWVEHLKSQK